VDPRKQFQDTPDVAPEGLPLYGFSLVDGKATTDYCEITDTHDLCNEMDTMLKNYNAENPPLNIFIFQFSMEHILRICRAIRMNNSHMLLMGLGGSGKVSLCKLASVIMDVEYYNLETRKNEKIDNWKDEIKKLLKRAGVNGIRVSLIVNDSYIAHEVCFEDINSLLKSGEIPMLFPAEEEAWICNEISTRHTDVTTPGK
jgi:dynein heavy chain